MMAAPPGDYVPLKDMKAAQQRVSVILQDLPKLKAQTY